MGNEDMTADHLHTESAGELTTEEEVAIQEELARDHDTADTASENLASTDQFHEQIGQTEPSDFADEAAFDDYMDSVSSSTATASDYEKDLPD